MTDRMIAILACLALAGAASAAQVEYELVSPTELYTGWFGWSVSAAGDVDDDGYGDFLVGAMREGASPDTAGRAHIFSGADGTLIRTLVSPNAVMGGGLGWAVAGVGDVDGDGGADVLATAPGEPGEPAYVFRGVDGSVLHTLTSPGGGGAFGWSASTAGEADVSADGIPDIIIGAWNENGGHVYVFSGADGSVIWQLASPDSSEPNEAFGHSVSCAGDVNADGIPDIIAGSPFEEGPAGPDAAGRAYVFSGADGNPLYTLVSPNEEMLAGFGWSVSGAGDADADGYDDVLVGAWAEDGSLVDAGRAYIFSGATGSILHTLMPPEDLLGGYFGSSVSGVGDVDGDGHGDVVVGADSETPAGFPHNSGRAYVFSGGTGALLDTLITPHPEQYGYFGWRVAGAGRVDRDGYHRVLVGAYQEDPGASPDSCGRAYVFRVPGFTGSGDPGATPIRLRLEGPYPNPTSDGRSQLVLSMPGGSVGNAALGLYDVGGRLVESIPVRMHGQTGSVSLTWTAGTGIAPGVYWWRLSCGDRQVQKAMVVLR